MPLHKPKSEGVTRIRQSPEKPSTGDYPSVTEREKLFGEPVLSDIRDEWGWVKAGIEEIIGKDDQLNIIPEDVFTACRTGGANLWTTDEGFVVTTGETDLITGERTFLVWLAWAEKSGSNVAVKWYWWFESQAREAGFTRFEVRTKYPKLGDYLQKELGFDLVTAQFARKITDG